MSRQYKYFSLICLAILVTGCQQKEKEDLTPVRCAGIKNAGNRN